MLSLAKRHPQTFLPTAKAFRTSTGSVSTVVGGVLGTLLLLASLAVVLVILWPSSSSAPTSSASSAESAVTASAPASMYSESTMAEENLPQEIDVHEAQARIAAGALHVDVRELDEFEALSIPGSTLVPLSEFMSRYQELPQDRDIVVSCRSGRRSAQAADFLNANGYRAINVAGGILAWEEAQLPLEGAASQR